jgi:hypothetical protein
MSGEELFEMEAEAQAQEDRYWERRRQRQWDDDEEDSKLKVINIGRTRLQGGCTLLTPDVWSR